MRLPNGYGSVYKLSGKRRKPWIARVTQGWEEDESTLAVKQIYKVIGYYETRKTALEALSEYHRLKKEDVTTKDITLEELYEMWSKEHFETVSKSTKYTIKSSWKVFSPIHSSKPYDLKLKDLQQVVDQSNKNTPTLEKCKLILGQMYDYAIKHELLPADKRKIISYIDISKPGNPNKIVHKPFLKEEVELLWENADNKGVSIILILIYTGLRIGELLNLKKDDIHLEERWFFVNESKTESGIREVPICEKIAPLMEYWIKEEGEYFISEADIPYFKYHKYIKSLWNPIMKSLSLNHIPHDTRHTFISFMGNKGIDERIIKAIAGHKGASITESIYTHITLASKLEAVNKL